MEPKTPQEGAPAADAPEPAEVAAATEAVADLVANAEADGAYVLQLFVTGATPRSQRAIGHIKAICEEMLHGRYTLEVVDVYQQPEALREQQIVAAPTLVKKLPMPLRRLVGDMSDRDRVLAGLNLKRRES